MGLWPIIETIAGAGGRSNLEESWAAVVKGKGKKSSGGRPWSWKMKLKPPSAYTIMISSKYTLAPFLPVTELMPSMEVSMMHTNAAI